MRLSSYGQGSKTNGPTKMTSSSSPQQTKAKKLTVLIEEAIIIWTRFKNQWAYKDDKFIKSITKTEKLTVSPNALGHYRTNRLTLSP